MKKFFATVAMALTLMSANAAIISVAKGYVFGNEDATNAELKRFPTIYDALMQVKEGDKITFKVTAVASEEDCVEGPYLAVKDKWKDVKVFDAEEIVEGAEFTFVIQEYKKGTKTIMKPADFNKADNAVAVSARGVTVDIYMDIADAEAPAAYTGDKEGEKTVYYNPEGLDVDWGMHCMFDEYYFKGLEVGGQLELDFKDVDNSNPEKPAQVVLQDHNDWKTFLSNDANALTNSVKVLVPIENNKMVWTVGEDQDDALYYMNGDQEGPNLKGQNCKLTRIVVRSKAAVAAGINSIKAENKIVDGRVFNLNGQMVSKNGNVEQLPQGVYIHNGKALIKK